MARNARGCDWIQGRHLAGLLWRREGCVLFLGLVVLDHLLGRGGLLLELWQEAVPALVFEGLVLGQLALDEQFLR